MFRSSKNRRPAGCFLIYEWVTYPLPEIKNKSLRWYLKSLFEVLEQNGILYCVFRDYDKMQYEETEKEIDLFVDPAHLKNFERTLFKREFYKIPAWGHEPHQFYIAYIKDLGTWLKLDVINAFWFAKPVNALGLEFSKSYLLNRTRRELAFVPTVEDKFLILLLKCIINDKGFPPERKARLVEIYREIAADRVAIQRISQNLKRYFGSALSWELINKTLPERKWDTLLEVRKKVIRRLFWYQPGATIGRYFKILFLKRARPLLFMFHHRGISVALLAPDGAGKSTLAYELIEQRYLNARLIYMGSNINASNVGLPTTFWLKAVEKKKKKRILWKWIFSVLNFPNQLIEQWYRLVVGRYHILRGRTVIFDRFVYDSWINPRDARLKKQIRRWLSNRTCLNPDLVILLDAPGTVLFARKGEHTSASLEIKRRAYLDLKNRLPNLVVIDATQGLETIQQELISLLWRYYGIRDLKKVLHGQNKNTN